MQGRRLGPQMSDRGLVVVGKQGQDQVNGLNIFFYECVNLQML